MAIFEFPQACGICVGTPVRIRGVNVGNVVRVNPSLKSIEAVVEVDDDKIFIPRNSIVEVNQSGLLMETMIEQVVGLWPVLVVGLLLDARADCEALVGCWACWRVLDSSIAAWSVGYEVLHRGSKLVVAWGRKLVVHSKLLVEEPRLKYTNYLFIHVF